VKAIVAQRGASVANKTVTNRYGIIRRGQEQRLGAKNQPYWVGKHSSWHSACRLAGRAEARTHFNS